MPLGGRQRQYLMNEIPDYRLVSDLKILLHQMIGIDHPLVVLNNDDGCRQAGQDLFCFSIGFA